MWFSSLTTSTVNGNLKMPYKDPAKEAACKLEYSRRPRQREYQRRLRNSPGYTEYITPIKRRNLLQRYGLQPEDYKALLDKQKGLCAVCGTDKPGNGVGDRYMDIDHCHATGKVRGLLCRRCNVTAGVLEKNRERIALIEKYLASHCEYEPEEPL